MEKELVKYSEAFKMQIVKELETGKLRSRLEAAKRYGIRGSNTVSKWVSKYGSEQQKQKVVRVETIEERDQMKVLKERIKELERAVVDSRVSEAMHKAYFDMVCGEFGIEGKAMEELKKNIARKWSRGE